MKVGVRFDLRDEFEIPLGDMTGEIELSKWPSKGDRIDIASGCQALYSLGLPLDVLVVGVEEAVPDGGGFAMLEALYVDNAEVGLPLIRALQDKVGLFFFPYREGLE